MVRTLSLDFFYDTALAGSGFHHGEPLNGLKGRDIKKASLPQWSRDVFGSLMMWSKEVNLLV